MKKLSLLTATALLATAFPVAGTLPAQDRKPAYPPETRTEQQPSTPDNPPQSKTFSGKIKKADGKYVLEDSSVNTSYLLDDQKTARSYEGKTVMVTGTLDASSNTIHVQKIEAAV